MKKLFITLAVATMTIMSADAQGVYAGNQMTAFKHVGIGFEVGTMGAGVNLAMPVVTDHLVLSVGYNFPNISYNTDFDISVSGVNNDIRQLNSKIRELNGLVSNYGLTSDLRELNQLNGEVNAKGKLNMGNAKVMLEYYPAVYSNFHLTFGVMIGNEKFIEFEGSTSKNDWGSYKTLRNDIDRANSLANQVNSIAGTTIVQPLNTSVSEVSFDLDGKTYCVEDLNGDGTGDVKASLDINKIKPYFGLGFGRSLPTSRVGFQFEIGAWYHGKPKLNIHNPTTNNQGLVDTDDDLQKVIDKVKDFPIYPQITFRLIGKIL